MKHDAISARASSANERAGLSDGLLNLFNADQVEPNEAGKLYAKRVATEPASRRVQAGPAHKTTRFASGKMQRVIQCESDLELAFVLQAEFSSSIFQYYDQPQAVRVSYRLADGRNGGGYKTPDYLAIDASGRMALIECKPRDQFAKLAAENSNRYFISPSGTCRDLALEDAALQMGMSATVFTESHRTPALTRNIRFLAGYLDDRQHLSEVEQKALSDLLSRCPAIWLDHLTAAGQAWKPDDVYLAIARNRIYVDLNRYDLGGMGRVPVYKSEQYAKASEIIRETTPIQIDRLVLEPNEPLIWDGRIYKVLNVGATHVALMSIDEKVLSLPWSELSKMIDAGAVAVGTKARERHQPDPMLAFRETVQGHTPEELEQALTLYETFRDVIEGRRPAETAIERRVVAKHHKEQAISGNGILGLVLHHRAKGNRTRRISPEVEKIVEKSIRDEASLPTRIPLKLIFGRVCRNCKESHLPAPSRKLFYKIAKSLSDTSYLSNRLGAKRAYQLQGSVTGDSSQADRRGSRIWERAFIDSTTCDIELVDRETGVVLGRPYLTVLRDGFSGRHLSFWISFDPPGALSVIMCLRICVVAHKRLPDFIVHDGGSEYKSADVERLFAIFQRHMIQRRVSKPRDGALIESGFSVVTKEIFYCLDGNTQATHIDPRSCTAAINPRALAVWTLADLDQLLRNYFSFRDNAWSNPTWGQTANERYLHSEQVHGARIFSRIEYDHNFLMATMPQVDRTGTRKLKPNGFTLYGRSYYNPVCDQPRHHGEQVSVRYDPMNIGRAFAFIDGRWQTFLSAYNAEFSGLSEREVSILSTEVTHRRALGSRSGIDYAEALADFHAQSVADRSRNAELLRARDTRTLAANVPDVPEPRKVVNQTEAPLRTARRRPDRSKLLPYASTER